MRIATFESCHPSAFRLMRSVYQHRQAAGANKLALSLMDTVQINKAVIRLSAHKTLDFHLNPPAR
jgi:hypothetical protein